MKRRLKKRIISIMLILSVIFTPLSPAMVVLASGDAPSLSEETGTKEGNSEETGSEVIQTEESNSEVVTSEVTSMEDGNKEVKEESETKDSVLTSEAIPTDESGNPLKTVLEEDTLNTHITLYTLANEDAVTIEKIGLGTLVEGIEPEQAYGISRDPAKDSDKKVWIKTELSENTILGERESISLYTVKDGALGDLIAEDADKKDAFIAVPDSAAGIVVVKDTGLRHQAIVVSPNEENNKNSISLTGMMPKEAEVQALDVTDSCSLETEQSSPDGQTIAAYDISILDTSLANAEDGNVPVTGADAGKMAASIAAGAEEKTSEDTAERKYQPEANAPIRVEIKDPRIVGGDILLYHITDEGKREQITDFEVSDGVISFDAYGFSIYEIVTLENVDPSVLVGWTRLNTLDDLLNNAGNDIYIGINRSITTGTESSGNQEVKLLSSTVELHGGGNLYGLTKTNNKYYTDEGADIAAIRAFSDKKVPGAYHLVDAEIISGVTCDSGKKTVDGIKCRIAVVTEDGVKYLKHPENADELELLNNQTVAAKNEAKNSLILVEDKEASTWFVVCNKQYNTAYKGQFEIRTLDKTTFHSSIADGGTAKYVYLNSYGGENQNVLGFWTGGDNGGDDTFRFWIYNPYEPYQFDDSDLSKNSYGIFHYTEGDTKGTALMAEAPNHALVKMVIHEKNTTRVLYVDQDQEISKWTFEPIVGTDQYKIRTDNGYLCADASGVSVNGEGTGFTAYAISDTTVRLKSGDYFVTYKAPASAGDIGSFGTTQNTDDNTKLYLLDEAELTEGENLSFSADRVSVSDAQNRKKYMVYTRIWNEKELHYDMYAIDHDGSLYPVYASGGKIVWMGDATDSLLWTFIEYKDAVTNEPNYYYDLYNEYSEVYLSPQLSNGQLLSDKTIGLIMPGRKSGDYYSEISAWDDNRYAYASIKNSSNNKTAEVCPQSAGLPFYFATLESVNQFDSLHEVPTIDNKEFGITMKMIDFGCVKNGIGGSGGNGSSTGADVTQYIFGGKESVDLQYGLLSTDLKEDGYPTVTEKYNANTPSLAGAYTNAQTVNHLFLDSVYNSSGYFEYDSAQNFATLVDQEQYKANGTFKYNTDFTVYRELGTHDKNSAIALSHGQFFPYDTIKAGTFSTKNPENTTNSGETYLSNGDPRKYEKLYLIQTDKSKQYYTDENGNPTTETYTNGQVNYYFGMELGASFVQTPSGLDSFGHDMIFEFKGDDDFWLYVDGELVIDLGGTHKGLPGSVNFRTGDVVVNGNATNLLEVFRKNYTTRNPSATPEQIKEYLDKYFGYSPLTGEQEKIFKDYSVHTMRVFYMERGANASNLYMRFNLSAVTPGNVTVQKAVKSEDGTDANINLDMVQYPFQIWYEEKCSQAEYEAYEGQKEEREIEGGSTVYCIWKQLRNEGAENVAVKYQNSNQKVIFVDKYVPPGKNDVEYKNVYYISPGKNIEIDFPENTIRYKLVECAVDTKIYNVEINGEPASVEAGSIHGDLRSYVSEITDSETTPVVAFDNIISDDVIRTLEITKRIVDKNDQEITNDDTKFKFRLYLSNLGSDANQLQPADRVEYHLVSPDGYYCKWDYENQKFVETGWVYDITGMESQDLSALTTDQRESITFKTSMYGAIDKIPARYKICVPNLPAGTVFKIEERENEMPSGYDLKEYRHIKGYKEIEGHRIEVPSYTEINSAGDKHVYNVGMVIYDQDPKVDVVNKRGYSLRVNKAWSDLELTTYHDPIYTAVYVDGTLLDGTVRQIKSPDLTTYYFWESLVENRSNLNDYEVYEVIPQGSFTVDENGVVTGYSELTKLNKGDKNHGIKATLVKKEGETEAQTKTFDYVVNYSKGDGETARTDTVTNVRDGALQIRLFKWKVEQDEQVGDVPLAGGIFTVTDLTTGEVKEYTSSADGTVTILYDYVVGREYKVEQKAAPKGYIGLLKDEKGDRNNFRFVVNNDHTVTLKKSDGTDWTNTEELKYTHWANGKPGTNGITAFVDIYNKPLNFKVIKLDEDGEKLDGVVFALYKQVKSSVGGNSKNKTPLTGFESIVTNENGELILSGKVSETEERMLYPGDEGSVYYLEEKTPKTGYRLPDEDVVFRLSALGEPTLISGGSNLQFVETEDEYVLTVDMLNEKDRIPLTVTKTVSGNMGDKTKDFTFTFTTAEGDTAAYEWTKNGVKQDILLTHNDTFTLAHGDKAVIMIPTGKNVKISEDPDGYKASVKINTAAATNVSEVTLLNLKEETTLAFENKLEADIPTGVFLKTGLMILTGFIAVAGIAAILYFRQRRKKLLKTEE